MARLSARPNARGQAPGLAHAAAAALLFAFSGCLLFALPGCGAKSILTVPPPARDGGLAMDAGPPDGGPGLRVDCGRSRQFTTPRRPIDLEAEAESSDAIVSEGWELISAPDGVVARNAPTTGRRTTLFPDGLGEYRMRYSATDAAGVSASCEVIVEAIVGPPRALCPEEELTVGPGVTLTIIGDGFDDEEVVGFAWDLVSAPPGARPILDHSGDGILRFSSNVSGEHTLRLTVFDADMSADSCEIVVRVVSPPEVFCPPSPLMAPTRQPVTIEARATDDRRVTSVRWELLSTPEGSSSSLRPTDAPATTMTPDRRGEYRMRFTAFDDDGLSASCEVTVIGTPTPPEAICPASVETRPLTPTMIMGQAIDDGTIVSYRWRYVMGPTGSTAGPPSPANAATTTFLPDIAGEYRLELTVTDDDGMTDSCTVPVLAIAVEGLRVEVFWDTDGTDMDTHLLNPSATSWFNDTDCYYANCNAGGGTPILSWGAPGTDDDPALDLDDTDGFGPENINIDVPQNGTYRVGVHAFRGNARVTVRIYCGGSTTMPRQTFGPVNLRMTDVFWRVADVEIAGGRCTIRELEDLSTETDARARR